jgi:GT2 family glycosyltransferase
MNKIFAIIVTYNGDKYIEKCLNSLLTGTVIPDIIAIDNNSLDLTVNILEKNYPNVLLFKSNDNLGFGKANNIGIKHALEMNASYIFLLNQDAWVEPDTIGKLVDISVQNPGYYIISPVHLNNDGSGFDKGFQQYALPPFCEDFFYDIYSGKREPIYSTSFVNAAAWLVKSDAIRDIGYFDPLFFHYGEDKDYCNRIIFHKKKIGIVPGSTVYHLRESGISKNPGIIGKLKSDVYRNYFLKLIDLKRLDQSFFKLSLSHSFGLLYSILKKLLTLKFYRVTIEVLTLINLLTNLPAIYKHRGICIKPGPAFSNTINNNSIAGN